MSSHPLGTITFFFKKRTTKIMQTTICETKTSWCSRLDFSLGAGWVSLELRSAWAFLGTAILFEPLTASLVDLDE